MNPNYNQIITVFRKVGTAWSKSVFEQCFWKSGITVVQNDTEASQTNTYTVRIPLEAAGSDFSASPGDVVVLGECADEITGKSPNTAAEVLRRNKRFLSAHIQTTPPIGWRSTTDWGADDGCRNQME